MSKLWIATIGTSIVAFLLKYLGHSIPAGWLAHPKIQQINLLIPIAMLSALVGVQTLTNNSQILINQRVVGMSVAVLALLLKAPFPVVVLSAAITSSAVYNFL